MEDSKRADRIRRIRGLLEKAAATDSEHEREALHAKAMKLMAQYGIEDAQLNASGETSGREPFVQWQLDRLDVYERERFMLLASIATPLRCVVVRQTLFGQPVGYKLVGFAGDAERVKLLFQFLDVHALQRMRAERPGTRRHWLQGFSLAINVRLQEIEGILVQETTTPGTDLILADRGRQVEREARRIFAGATEEEFDQPQRNAASVAGYREGQRVDLAGSRRIGEPTRRSVGR